jgi:hypothetical protein
MESICSDSQTYCNIVQSDLSDTELGGHLGGKIMGQDVNILYHIPLGIFIAIDYCSSPAQGQRCDAQDIFSDISPTLLKEADIGCTIR